MRLRAIAAVLLASLALVGAAPAQQGAGNETTTLKVGDIAPDFTLPDQDLKQVKLSDFKGKQNVVLAFYVLAFTPG